MNTKKVWMHTPDAGGVKIPPPVRSRTTERITRYAEAQYRGRYSRLDIRYRGVFCYIDAYLEPSEPSPELLNITSETREEFIDRMRKTPTHLCRLRYFGDEEAWGLAFYTYSNERYELCMYCSGGFLAQSRKHLILGQCICLQSNNDDCRDRVFAGLYRPAVVEPTESIFRLQVRKMLKNRIKVRNVENKAQAIPLST